jgi:hypothetical protein
VDFLQKHTIGIQSTSTTTTSTTREDAVLTSSTGLLSRPGHRGCWRHLAKRDPSYSTSQRTSPRGLGYFYSTTWEVASLKSISGHILQDDLSIREEVLDSRFGGSVPRVLRFFLSGFFGIFLPSLQMDPQPEPAAQPKARGLLHMECDFAITPPYQLWLQDKTEIF